MFCQVIFSKAVKESMLILGRSKIYTYIFRKTNGKNFHITLIYIWKESSLTLCIWIKLLVNILCFTMYNIMLKCACLLLSYRCIVSSRQPCLGRVFLAEWDEAALTCDMLYTIHIVRVSDPKLTMHLWFSDVWN